MSGDNELSISGKAPVRDSWVKINEVGNVALRITDGVYYASKDFDETGVIVTEDEEAALTREELATELAELRAIVEGNVTSINSVTTTVSNLTDKTKNDNIFLKTYPVGSIYTSVINTNPGEIYGGEWVSFGSGKTIVGVDSSDTDFNTVEKTGGSKDMQSHTHTFEATTDIKELIGKIDSHGASSGGFYFGGSGIITLRGVVSNKYYTVDNLVSINGAPSSGRLTIDASHNHIVSGTTANEVSGNSGNLQPYITVYMCKRTA